jgi:hypothetical protein
LPGATSAISPGARPGSCSRTWWPRSPTRSGAAGSRLTCGGTSRTARTRRSRRRACARCWPPTSPITGSPCGARRGWRPAPRSPPWCRVAGGALAVIRCRAWSGRASAFRLSACRSRRRRRRTCAASTPAGADVLVVDDTWVSGGSAQSAAVALKLAGARRVAIIVIGRHVNPDDPQSAQFLEALPAAPAPPAPRPAQAPRLAPRPTQRG